MSDVSDYKVGQLLMILKDAKNVQRIIEEVLVPSGLDVLRRHNRLGLLLIKVPIGEENLWIANLKKNDLVSNVALNAAKGI